MPRRATLSSYAGPIPRPVVPIALRVHALGVEQLVVRQHEMRAVAHVESPFDVDPVRDELVDLGEQLLRVEHDAVSDRAAHALVEDSARDLVEHERQVAQIDRVSGVRAALIADHPVGALGQHVDQLSLPLVAPLCADNDDRAVGRAEHFRSGGREMERAG